MRDQQVLVRNHFGQKKNPQKNPKPVQIVVFLLKLGIIKHFVNEKLWWILGRKEKAGGMKKKVETFGLFLLPTPPWRTKNRWENYLIATNVNNNFNNFSRLSSSKTFPSCPASSFCFSDVFFQKKKTRIIWR